jgi:hypothetical protein
MADNGPELDSGDDWIEKLGSTNNADKSAVQDSAATDLFAVHGDGKVSGSVIKDEDDMSSDSADHLATQQSIKAYVDSNSGVDTANSPNANEYARFTDANTIEGRTASEAKGDLGFVTVDGTPADNDFAKFTDADTIEGRSSAEIKTDLGYMTDLVDDTDPDLGGDLDCNGNDIILGPNAIILDDTLSAAEWSGDIVTGQTFRTGVGQTIAVGDLLYKNGTTQEWELANATDNTTMLCAGVSLSVLSSSSTTQGECSVLLKGFIRKTGWSFTIGSLTSTLLYVDINDGNPSQAKPFATDNIIQCIGWVDTTNTIYFSPNWYFETVE